MVRWICGTRCIRSAVVLGFQVKWSRGEALPLPAKGFPRQTGVSAKLYPRTTNPTPPSYSNFQTLGQLPAALPRIFQRCHPWSQNVAELPQDAHLQPGQPSFSRRTLLRGSVHVLHPCAQGRHRTGANDIISFNTYVKLWRNAPRPSCNSLHSSNDRSKPCKGPETLSR